MMLPSVAQMIADLGHDEPEATNRTPHPSSLSGDLVELCKKSPAEQVWLVEERGFERRLKLEVLKRHERGASPEELERFTERHRRRWRDMRLTARPRVVRDREEPYREHFAALEVPLHWTEGAI